MTIGRAIGILVVIYLMNWLAIHVFDVYGAFPNFDIIMHTLGGVGAGVLGLTLYELGKGNQKLPDWMKVVFVMGVVMIMAVGWEWHEFALDALHGTSSLQLSIADTMLDMLCGFIGGAILLCVVKR